MTVAVNTQNALASFSQEITATIGPAFSAVNTVSTAVATLDGYAGAQQTVTLNSNGYVVGTNFINGGPGQSAF